MIVSTGRRRISARALFLGTLLFSGPSFGRGREARTPDLRIWNPLLYQLSYTPVQESILAGLLWSLARQGPTLAPISIESACQFTFSAESLEIIAEIYFRTGYFVSLCRVCFWHCLQNFLSSTITAVSLPGTEDPVGAWGGLARFVVL
jgi:hypothetical protein